MSGQLRARQEFMVMHKLGVRYSAPQKFNRKEDALAAIEAHDNLMGELGLEPGMVLHTRYVTEWEEELGRNDG